jgi:hypothetical protein
MQLKDNINIFQKLGSIFILPFLFSVLICTVLFLSFSLQIKIYNNLIFYIGITSALWMLFLKIKTIQKESIRQAIFMFFRSLFFSTISFLILFNFIPSIKNNLSENTPIIIFATLIFCGFITYSQQINQIKQKLDTHNAIERQIQENNFRQKFPKIQKIPILSAIFRSMNKEGWFYSISLIIITLSFLFFGLMHIGKFMSVDEPKWVDTRVPQLFEAIKNQTWADTYINDKPGVLPAFLSGTVNIFLPHNTYKNNPIEYSHYLFWWRTPIVFFNFFMLFLIYHFGKKLITKDKSVLMTGFIALNPILIGISQIVNPDSTLWSTAFISFLTFFLFLKTNENKYIWYSGIFLGLALISKYSASILYIFFFGVIYLEYLLKITDRQQLQNRFFNFIKIILLSVGVYTLLFPITWVDTLQILRGTIAAKILSPGKSIILIAVTLLLVEFHLLKGKIIEKIKIKNYLTILLGGIFYFSLLFLFINVLIKYQIFDPGDYVLKSFQRGNIQILKNLMTSGYTILFTLTPPVFLGIFALPFVFFKQKHKDTFETLMISSIFFLILLYIGGTTLGGFIATARYQILLYPLYAFLATFGFSIFKSQREKIIYFSLLFSIILLFQISPFFFTYNNIFNKEKTPITDIWGFGGYEVAQIFNKEIFEKKNPIIWSDREGVNEFFIGEKYWRGRDNPFTISDINFLILTRGGEKIFRDSLRTQQGKYYAIAPQILPYYEKTPDFTYCIPNNPNDCYRIVKFTNK